MDAQRIFLDVRTHPACAAVGTGKGAQPPNYTGWGAFLLSSAGTYIGIDWH